MGSRKKGETLSNVELQIMRKKLTITQKEQKRNEQNTATENVQNILSKIEK